jgi:hypothetical protein
MGVRIQTSYICQHIKSYFVKSKRKRVTMIADVCSPSSLLAGNNLPFKFSHLNHNNLADSVSSEKNHHVNPIEIEAGFGGHIDEIADVIDLVSLHEMNNIQRVLDCASNAVCSRQTSWSVARGPATLTVLQLLHQLGSVNRLIDDIIRESIEKRCHTWRKSDSGPECPGAVISLDTAIEAACGDLTFLVSRPISPHTRTHAQQPTPNRNNPLYNRRPTYSASPRFSFAIHSPCHDQAQHLTPPPNCR